VPLKPSCEVIEMALSTRGPPTITSGNALGSVTTKSGFGVTTSVNDVASGAGAPAVAAWIVTG
jgi:hypothetical protein